MGRRRPRGSECCIGSAAAGVQGSRSTLALIRVQSTLALYLRDLSLYIYFALTPRLNPPVTYVRLVDH